MLLLAVLATLLLGASGCAAGPSSWPGLTVSGDRLYAADLQQIRVLDTTDGALVWAFPENTERENYRGEFYATPVVTGGRVIATSQMRSRGFLSQSTNTVWGVGAENGELLWQFDGATGRYVESGAVADTTFVIGNGDSNVYALDIESGDLEWKFETGHRVWATPLIISDTVYIGSMDRHLYALRLSDGDEVWRFSAGGAFASRPTLRGDTLYIGAFDNRVYAISTETGTERWRFPAEGTGDNWFWGSPVVRDDTLYAVDVKGNVYALDAETGELIWHRELDDEQPVPVRAGPALNEDGSRLFIGSKNGTLYALDTAEGTVKWKEEAKGEILSTPVVSGSVVYEALILGEQRVRALDADSSDEIWAYSPEAEEEQ